MQDLQVQGLVKTYSGRDGVAAVDGVDIAVQGGEMLVLLGPSGCGKTTLLRCIAGLEDGQQGLIRLGGRTVFDAAARRNLPTHLRDIGLVFQNYSLWPHMTVGANVEYPLRARGVAAAARGARVQEALAIVQCAHLRDRLPAMLSGGQQQRIALARALASSPSVMLLDEPLSNLDALLRVELRAQLRAIHREVGFTGIYVTHDQTEAFNLGSRVAVMKAGRIEQLGTPAEVYAQPATEYVARFLGISNALGFECRDGTWTGEVGVPQGDLGVCAGTAEPFSLYVRPEHLRLAPASEARRGDDDIVLPAGVVQDALFGGGEVDYVVKVGSQLLHAKVAAPACFKPGEPVLPYFGRAHALAYRQGRLLRR